ncbi:MAG: formate dehydrogenase subunit alpha, partial [Gammaproteobacteria bacterium]|nr:formate dehydrogenase subunit alpha [Gammaproteobacteria bacterium]
QGASGEEVLFREAFHTADGKGRLVPATPADAAEMPSDDFPWVLITGRQLEHWHTGAMTRRARVLDAIEPEPVASLSPDDLARLGVEPGERVVVSSRRGSVTMYARLDSAMQPGQVFLPFAYHEAAANLLTNEALDPFGKIPEFKFCAVRVEPPAKGRRAGAA